VKSRIKYILPAFMFAIILYYVSAQWSATESIMSNQGLKGSPKGLPMLLVPAFVIFLFLKGKHLLHGLMYGIFSGMLIGLIFGLLPINSILSLDLENMVAKSFVIDGINRAVGISFFTILLMGLVATLKASGLVDRLVKFAEVRSKNEKDGEKWIAVSVTGAVMLITHGVVAILMVAEFAIQSGEKLGMNGVRRSNILSLIACVFPFLLPYFIPVILMANTTNSGTEFGVAQVGALEVGMHNFLSWGLLIMALLAVFFGYGRRADAQISIENKEVSSNE
jgi:Na+/H+ antiporter NhaC